MSNTRANKQIWRLAEWLHQNVSIPEVRVPDWKMMRANPKYYEGSTNFYYDKAAELLKKISRNEFTGGDNHRD